MKRLFTLLVAAAAAFSLLSFDAEAKRLGGGSSIGKQRQSISPVPRAPAAAPAPVAPQPSGASKWLGPLAGLAAGGLLASMFMGGGMGAMGSILPMILLAGVAFLIISMLRRPQAQPMQYAGMGNETVSAPPPSQAIPIDYSQLPSGATNSIPDGFDANGFLHNAKVNFVRLQAANDTKNLSDIREFSTPEMYAELSLQIQEREDTPQQTDVVTLNADLLDVSVEADHYIASVRFSGLIKENPSTAAENFAEIWHLQKPLDGRTGWLIAGIQQVN